MVSRIPKVMVLLTGIALLAVAAILLLVAPLTASEDGEAHNCGFGIVIQESDSADEDPPGCNAARLDRVTQILVLSAIGATLTIGASFVPYRTTR
jgi:hypothetical protein